jgi:methyl-accepting chemotaxis protein
VDDLVSEVASASIEQSQGIAQVNLAVAEMDKVTQRNAANAEESASASQELTGQAGTLQELGINLRDLVSGHATVSDVQARALEISFQADSPTEPAQNVRYSPGRSGRASAL